MTDAIIVTRKSQGTDEDISLDIQKQTCEQIALEDLDLSDNQVEVYDFGVHTGFSQFTKDEDQDSIDTHPKMKQIVEKARNGEIDYIIAYDDTRLARDKYLTVIQYYCLCGGVQIVFGEEGIDLDSMSGQVVRTVEKEVKKKEIRKAKEALKQKQERGEPLGPAPTGLKYNEAKTKFVPGNDFDLVRTVLSLRDQGKSYSDISEKTGMNRGTVYKICNDHRDKYDQYL